jgi:hypothetical protein
MSVSSPHRAVNMPQQNRRTEERTSRVAIGSACLGGTKKVGAVAREQVVSQQLGKALRRPGRRGAPADEPRVDGRFVMPKTSSARIQDHFADLTDPRQRTTNLPLTNIRTIAICAVTRQQTGRGTTLWRPACLPVPPFR